MKLNVVAAVAMIAMMIAVAVGGGAGEANALHLLPGKALILVVMSAAKVARHGTSGRLPDVVSGRRTMSLTTTCTPPTWTMKTPARAVHRRTEKSPRGKKP